MPACGGGGRLGGVAVSPLLRVRVSALWHRTRATSRPAMPGTPGRAASWWLVRLPHQQGQPARPAGPGWWVRPQAPQAPAQTAGQARASSPGRPAGCTGPHPHGRAHGGGAGLWGTRPPGTASRAWPATAWPTSWLYRGHSSPYYLPGGGRPGPPPGQVVLASCGSGLEPWLAGRPAPPPPMGTPLGGGGCWGPGHHGPSRRRPRGRSQQASTSASRGGG